MNQTIANKQGKNTKTVLHNIFRLGQGRLLHRAGIELNNHEILYVRKSQI